MLDAFHHLNQVTDLMETDLHRVIYSKQVEEGVDFRNMEIVGVYTHYFLFLDAFELCHSFVRWTKVVLSEKVYEFEASGTLKFVVFLREGH